MTLATILGDTAAVVDERPPPGLDVYIRDSAADTGDQPSPHPHWHSPDVWVRNNPPPADPTDPTTLITERTPSRPPDAHRRRAELYVSRVHNSGPSSTPTGAFSVRAYNCHPGPGMVWPTISSSWARSRCPAPSRAGGSVRVGPFVWTPKVPDHECLLAIASGPGDQAVPDVYGGRLDHSLLVRYDNNVGQRNVTPQNAVPGGKTSTTFLVRGSGRLTANTLLIDAREMPADTAIQVRLLRRLVDGATHLRERPARPGQLSLVVRQQVRARAPAAHGDQRQLSSHRPLRRLGRSRWA